MVRPADKLQSKAASILPLVGFARSSETQSTVGAVLSIYTAPRLPGPRSYKPLIWAAAVQDELRRGREGCHHHGAARQPAACSHAAELRRELRDWKRRVETQVEFQSVALEIL